MQSSKDILLRLSAVLILFSAVLYLFMPVVASWTMLPAVTLFTVITITTPYPGKSIRGKRLFAFQVLSSLCMVVATYLMYRQQNEWVLAMIAGAVFLLYASILIPKELGKEKYKE